MAGMKIQPINVDKNGAIDMRHLRAMVSFIHVHHFPDFNCDLLHFPPTLHLFPHENNEIDNERFKYYRKCSIEMIFFHEV